MRDWLGMNVFLVIVIVVSLMILFVNLSSDYENREVDRRFDELSRIVELEPIGLPGDDWSKPSKSSGTITIRSGRYTDEFEHEVERRKKDYNDYDENFMKELEGL